MYIERVYDRGLAQASYVVGCGASGEAVVVDPIRDIEPYLEIARREGFELTHVTETHIHADYVSGARELVARTGARLYLSGEGGPDWQYAFAEEADAVLLYDGDSFEVGNVRIEALHTPGHTPEHLVFLVTDTVAADEPMGAFTGDFLFVGDAGRPDLLEKAAHLTDTMVAGARQLFHSLEAFKKLSDHLQIWPGHGAGSACGKSLGAVPTSTLGYEKRFNWALQYEDEDAFVSGILEGQPEPPMYFAEMKRMNRDGPPILGDPVPPRTLTASALEDLRASGGILVDARPRADFERGHIPGSFTIPLDGSFATWAGSVLPFDKPIALVLPDTDPERSRRAARHLEVVGLDHLEGVVGPEALEWWTAKGKNLEVVQNVPPKQLEEQLQRGEARVVDIRNSSEWEAKHIPGSLNLPLGRLPERLPDLPGDLPLVVYCGTGARALVGLGALRAYGRDPVLHLEGDLGAWTGEGLPVVSGTGSDEATRAVSGGEARG